MTDITQGGLIIRQALIDTAFYRIKPGVDKENNRDEFRRRVYFIIANGFIHSIYQQWVDDDGDSTYPSLAVRLGYFIREKGI